MIEISKIVSQLAASQTLAMAQKSAELRAQGIDVINLSLGEPDFTTPAHIKEAAEKAIDDNFSFYTPVAGYLSLREAIARDMNRHENVSCTAANIVVSNGAKQSLFNALFAILNPGDEVIIPAPAWVSYIELVKLTGATSVIVPTHLDTDFKMTPEMLEKSITPATRVIIMTSPSNPTGSVYSREELQGLVDVISRHQRIIVISDEIYEHINFTGSFTSLASFPELNGRVAIINGVSKAYAMTGWRIGFVAAPEELAKACTKLQGQTTSNPSSIAQKAAEAAYNGPQECVSKMCAVFRRRRNLVVRLAREIPGWEANEPMGAFYLFPRVEACLGKTAPDGTLIATSGDLAMYLLRVAHVATVDGAAFAAPGYLRLSYAASDEKLTEALRRIREAVISLK